MGVKAIIEVEGLVKHFGNVEALRGLSFKVPRSISGLIGPNGAGKTTTIRILLGLIKADQGQAKVLDFDCWKESLKIRTKVGFLHEKPAFYEHMTGLEYLELIAEIKGLQDSLSESRSALNLVQLIKESQERQIRGYSAGMRQRLGIAQALLGEPELVILDEPTSNLDPLGRIQLLETIDKISKEEGVSFLISSHVLPELERVCNHLIMIHEGQAVKEGSLKHLLDEIQPKTFRIRVEPIQPLVALLEREHYVKKIWVEDGYIWIITENTDLLKSRLPKLLSSAGAALEEMRTEEGLEFLFKRYIDGR